ncbi:unnamed protein product [Sympodiomycopsis kandeliae]
MSLQTLTTNFQKGQIQLQSLIEARQQLDSQLSENVQVQKEFKNLKPSNNVYKLMGPVLMKTDTDEAKSNVEKRIEFITSEIEKVERQLKEVSTQSEQQRQEIIKLQQQQQQSQQQQQQQGAKA